jgi:hypothetical protein
MNLRSFARAVQTLEDIAGTSADVKRGPCTADNSRRKLQDVRGDSPEGWLATRSSLVNAGERRVVARICPRWNHLQAWFELAWLEHSRTPHGRLA